MNKLAESHYQHLFDEAHIGIVLVSANGEFIDANQALVEMLGFPDLDTLVSTNFSSLYSNPDTHSKLVREAVESHRSISKNIEFKCFDGTSIPVRNTISTFRRDDESQPHFAGVIEDLTKQTSAETALRESLSRVESEKAQRHLAEKLREVSHILISTLEFNEVLDKAFTALASLIPYDSAALFLLEGPILKVAAYTGITNQETVKQLAIELSDDPISEKIIKTCEPVVIHNATNHPLFKNYGEVELIESWLGVPLISREKVIGLLTLDSITPDIYQEREIEITFTFASQLAVAIENARLFSEEQRRANLMGALRATMADITSELDIDILLNAILQRAIQLLKATGGELALFNTKNDLLTIVACQNMDKDYTGFPLKPGEGAIGKVAVRGKPLLIDNYQTWEGHLPNYENWAWRSVIAVPLAIRNRILGVIALAEAPGEHIFNKTDLRMLMLFAQQAAIAIENANLFDQITSALTNTQALYQTARTLIETENITDLLNNLVEQVANALPAERVLLILIDSQKKEVSQIVIGGREGHVIKPPPYQELMDGLTGWVFREHKPALSTGKERDLREQPYVQQARADNKGGSLIVVPLLYHHQILGTLTAVHNDSGPEYGASDVSLLETIAHHAATAIKNAQMFETIQLLAETDDLTKVNNRRQLFKLGGQAFKQARRYNSPLSVIMLDIDDFKSINDSYGHAVGDIVLHALAQICIPQIRDADIFARYGGEEFVVILPNTGLEQCNEIAERLRESIENAPIAARIGALKITISLGIAELKPAVPNLAALIDRADTALYAAKRGGKNRVSR